MIQVLRVRVDFCNWKVILFVSNPTPQVALFLAHLEKGLKKKDAAQTPRRLGAPKPEFRMVIKILCGSERDRGLTGPWWNVKKTEPQVQLLWEVPAGFLTIFPKSINFRIGYWVLISEERSYGRSTITH